MPAVNYNFIIEQGSDFELNFQYSDENGNPVDLSDSSKTCVVLQTIPVIGTKNKFTTTDNETGYSLTATNTGLIRLKISSQLTKNYDFTTAIYDLDVLQDIGTSNPKTVRLAFGTITLQKRQTAFPTCQSGNTQQSGDTGGDTGGGGTPTPTPTPLPEVENLCLETDCLNLDVYSTVYQGSGLAISDMSTVSGYVLVDNSSEIENVELVISNLNYTYPQDLQLFLAPPSGDKILLSANHKMPQNSGNFNFMFSNKAQPTTYLHNVTNGGFCNISNKTSFVKYSNENLLSSFNHLFGHSLPGHWNLLARDTDPTGSGTIGGWKLVITYKPE